MDSFSHFYFVYKILVFTLIITINAETLVCATSEFYAEKWKKSNVQVIS